MTTLNAGIGGLSTLRRGTLCLRSQSIIGAVHWICQSSDINWPICCKNSRHVIYWTLMRKYCFIKCCWGRRTTCRTPTHLDVSRQKNRKTISVLDLGLLLRNLSFSFINDGFCFPQTWFRAMQNGKPARLPKTSSTMQMTPSRREEQE